MSSDKLDKVLELLDKVSEGSATNTEMIEYHITINDLSTLFEKYNQNNNFLEIIIRNSFYNLKTIYLKNNKLHTIENGKEISTQRDVDEATLSEIKMMLRGNEHND